MADMKILNDEDVERVPMSVLCSALSQFVVEDHEGRTTTPPRVAVDFPQGKLVFTTGGSDRLAGFRAYETFQSEARSEENQLVAVWDVESCSLKGVCFGNRLGALRTGALGGIAVNALAPSSAVSCAIVGSGLQAEAQLLGMLAHRDLRDIRVYSRSEPNRDAFIERLKQFAEIQPYANCEEAVAGAEIVILATNSWSPVVDALWLKDAKHITTVGPKFKGAHEFPIEMIDDDLLMVSDSPQQILAQGDGHMLAGHPRLNDVHHLGDIITRGGRSHKGQTLFLSAGLSGTEVIALDAAITYLQK